MNINYAYTQLYNDTICYADRRKTLRNTRLESESDRPMTVQLLGSTLHDKQMEHSPCSHTLKMIGDVILLPGKHAARGPRRVNCGMGN